MGLSPTFRLGRERAGLRKPRAADQRLPLFWFTWK